MNIKARAFLIFFYFHFHFVIVIEYNYFTHHKMSQESIDQMLSQINRTIDETNTRQSTPVPRRRNGYRIAEKVEALEAVEEFGMEEASIRTSISSKLLGEWEKDRPRIMAAKHARHRQRLPGGGRKSQWGDLESRLNEWIVSIRQCKMQISFKTLREKALELKQSLHLDTFRASGSWLNGFMRRYSLSYRLPTHRAQQNNKSSTAKCTYVFLYLNKLNVAASRYDIDAIYNMDETPFYFDILEKKTIELTGYKTVDVLHSGNDKKRFTVVVTIEFCLFTSY